MPEVNYEWVRQQLADAKVKVGPGNAVLKLLEVWEAQKLSANLAKEAVEIFSKLALNHSLADKASEVDEVWVPVQPGRITIGDEVRTLADAFEDGTHNGRRGKVIAVRYGDVIFKSTDGKMPVLDGVHYSPYKLEKRVK
jgi:hypothetical protein